MGRDRGISDSLEDIAVIGMRGHVCGQGKPVLGGASPDAAVFEQTDGSQHRTYCTNILYYRQTALIFNLQAGNRSLAQIFRMEQCQQFSI